MLGNCFRKHLRNCHSRCFFLAGKSCGCIPTGTISLKNNVQEKGIKSWTESANLLRFHHHKRGQTKKKRLFFNPDANNSHGEYFIAIPCKVHLLSSSNIRTLQRDRCGRIVGRPFRSTLFDCWSLAKDLGARPYFWFFAGRE
jgi:hypothetical protein